MEYTGHMHNTVTVVFILFLYRKLQQFGTLPSTISEYKMLWVKVMDPYKTSAWSQ